MRPESRLRPRADAVAGKGMILALGAPLPLVALLVLIPARPTRAEPGAPPRQGPPVTGVAPIPAGRTYRAEGPLWRIPHFFEVGRQVRLSPGAEPVDTTGWVREALEQDEAHRRSDLTALGTAASPDRWRIFSYPEVMADSGALRRYALFVPRGRATSGNGQATASWEPSADAFNFGVGGSRTFGNLTAGNLTALGKGRGTPRIHHLERTFQASGTNVQAYELAYAIEGTGGVLFEHKGLIPDLPVSFDRFSFSFGTSDPAQLPAKAQDGFGDGFGDRSGDGSMRLEIGLLPTGSPDWATLESFVAGAYRVLLASDGHGKSYFLAAPVSLGPTWYFGQVAADLVVESVTSTPGASASAHHQPACALFLPVSRIPPISSGPAAASGTVFSGELADGQRSELAARLERASSFLAAHDDALAVLRTRGPESVEFLRHYAHTFLDAHRSRRDPRALTALPFGDRVQAENALESPGAVRYGSDQARALLGLVSYARRTKDLSVIDAIWGITEASMEAMTPSGAVWRNRFDGMLVGEEEDASTRRADVFIDNGGVSVGFNHQRMVIRSGAPRAAGVTWGASSLVVGGKLESVESRDYGFAIDPSSIPETVRSDQESLGVDRLFTRQDGRLRVRETATLARGVPAARVREEIENRGSTPQRLDELRMTIGDFFQYGDGPSEMAQNRYGLSPVVDGTRLHVGLWMEGMGEPLWGDNFPPGWVDLTDIYRRQRPRFLVVYGYDKAEVYYLPQVADALVVYNAADGSSRSELGGARRSAAASAPPLADGDGYRGWTSLQIRYRANATLGPGAVYRSPDVYTYLMRAPLFSADGDTVPDELQSLVPIWTDLVEAARDSRSEAALRAELQRQPDRERAHRLEGLLHTALEPDDASIVMQAAWMESADLMSELAARATSVDERRALEWRALATRQGALRGAAYSLKSLTELRGRSDLMPAYGIGSNYGFHVLVFDWAYRATHDPRYRDAVLLLADRIAGSETEAGLQITDPSKPNFGGYLLNEQARAQGSSHLDDQGIKLWALRVAYERTLDPRYRRSAELFIDHWLQIRADDHRFFGTSKLFDHYVVTGPDQQMTPLGQDSLLIGLRAWADLSPRAARLHAEGMKALTERHPVDAIGTTGALDGGGSGGGNLVRFDTGTEVSGTLLLAMTFDAARLKGRWSVRPRKHEHPVSTVVEWAKGHPSCIADPHAPG